MCVDADRNELTKRQAMPGPIRAWKCVTKEPYGGGQPPGHIPVGGSYYGNMTYHKGRNVALDSTGFPMSQQTSYNSEGPCGLHVFWYHDHAVQYSNSHEVILEVEIDPLDLIAADRNQGATVALYIRPEEWKKVEG